MAESRISRLISLFDRALELPEARRAEFLDRVTDPVLRQEVVSLLEGHESSTDYFERLASSVVSPAYVAVLGATPASLRWEGRRIGAYRLVREVGRGGMSRVFLAERADGQFEQQRSADVVGPIRRAGRPAEDETVAAS